MFLLFALAGSGVVVATHRFRDDWYRTVCVALGLTVAVFVGLPLVKLNGLLCPNTVDHALALIDLRLGFHVIDLARFCFTTPWARNLLLLTYDSIPLAVAVSWVLEPNTQLLRSLIAATIAGACMYFIVPAVGPAHIAPGFPANPPLASWTESAMRPDLPRNCFPSLHFGWALLLYLNARNRWLRTALIGYAFLTALATLGSGEHYVVDLLIAVPFCVACQKFVEAAGCSPST